MNLTFLLELISYTIPALVVAALSYVYFDAILKRQSQRDKYIIDSLQNNKTIDTIALRLQAYERLTIFIERIDLQKLLLRIQLQTDDKALYSLALIQHITQEYEYNISQQVYVSEELWTLLTQHKNAIVSLIQRSSNLHNIDNPLNLQHLLIKESQTMANSTSICLTAIKTEAKQYL
ncbi:MULTISPECIES: hypothetical protein [Myroides]|uniref:Uncharacterized protein n=1 Tax=Myroides albus TaxID=2562892 RepID=A0A6I3LQJ7_9FLAO|nr:MULTISPECIES: hypothetical protein [Myroides]MTG98422.1 hypothetical protein [Myroides albus]MVX36577.1 hypothetical protein [Myroides sp. LoEW2-1]UVD79665.1 hypothetical protein NWE55_16340 [Myroides albus]